MASYTHPQQTLTRSSNASSEDFTFDISSAITSAQIPAYSKLTKVTITVWGDIDTSSSRGKMTANFGSQTICSNVYCGGSAGEVSRSADITISTYFNSENANAGKLKDSNNRLVITLDGPVMLAKFTHTARYQVYFEWTPSTTYKVDVDASPAEGGTVTGGGSYSSGATTTLKATAKTGWKFKCWQDDTSNTNAERKVTVIGNATYTAVFEKLTYTVRWYNEDGTKLLEEDTGVPYGDMPDCSVIPTKEATAEHTYEFIGWQIDTVSEGTTELTAVVKEINYYARFREIVNTYIVTWKNGNTVLETDEVVPYGTAPDYNGATPTKAKDAQYYYEFLGWNTEVDENPRQEEDLDDVTGHITYTAVFLPVLRQYSVEISINDERLGTVTGAESGTYDYGTLLTLTAVPQNGGKFLCWVDENYDILSENATDTFLVQGDISTITALFEVGGIQVGTTYIDAIYYDEQTKTVYFVNDFATDIEQTGADTLDGLHFAVIPSHAVSNEWIEVIGVQIGTAYVYLA